MIMMVLITISVVIIITIIFFQKLEGKEKKNRTFPVSFAKSTFTSNAAEWVFVSKLYALPNLQLNQEEFDVLGAGS